eukprot:m51a1_g14198 hypothetical protein (320) ;mRNA; f:117744-122283
MSESDADPKSEAGEPSLDDGDEEWPVCASCGDEISPAEDRLHCAECGSYDLCMRCFEETEETGHDHELSLLKGAMQAQALYIYDDARAQHKLVLTNIAGALPGSRVLSENGVGAVLSIVELDEGATSPEQRALRRDVYGDGTLRCARSKEGIVYHWIAMPDVSDPRTLPQKLARWFLPEATVFLGMALERTNVAVHCQLGLRRSPMSVAAYLATRGMTSSAALRAVAAGHAATRGWDDVLRRTRPAWVKRLEEWRLSWRKEQREWREFNGAVIETWEKMLAGGDAQLLAPQPVLVGSDAEDEDGEEDMDQDKNKEDPLS